MSISLFIIQVVVLFIAFGFFISFLINRLRTSFVNKEIQKLRRTNTYTLLSQINNVKTKSLAGRGYLSFSHCNIEFYKSCIVLYGYGPYKSWGYKIISIPIILFFNDKPLKKFEDFRQFKLLRLNYKQIFKDEIELRVKTSNKNWNFINDELTIKGLSEEQKQMFEYIKLSIDNEL